MFDISTFWRGSQLVACTIHQNLKRTFREFNYHLIKLHHTNYLVNVNLAQLNRLIKPNLYNGQD